MARARRLDDGGYIMVALLVAMAVTSVWMGSLLPSWHHLSMREKEADLIFRGEQYARAIELYRRKIGALPPNIDTLVSQRFLRRKYLDPITGKDFVPVGGAGSPGNPGQSGLTGVRSSSTEQSIVVYRNQQTYALFPFDLLIEQERSGAGGASAPSPGGRGQPPGGRGGPARGGQGAPPARGLPTPDEVAPIGPRQGGPRQGGAPPGGGRIGA